MAELELVNPVVSHDVSARAESPTRRAIRRFLRHRLALIGLVVIVVIVILAFLGDDEAANQQNLRLGFTNRPPGDGFLLGTDAIFLHALNKVGTMKAN